jgi:hypothetical protein
MTAMRRRSAFVSTISIDAQESEHVGRTYTLLATNVVDVRILAGRIDR